MRSLCTRSSNLIKMKVLLCVDMKKPFGPVMNLFGLDIVEERNENWIRIFLFGSFLLYIEVINCLGKNDSVLSLQYLLLAFVNLLSEFFGFLVSYTAAEGRGGLG